MQVILVAGTYGWRGQDAPHEWWWPTSPFADLVRSLGHTVLGAGRPFIWTTDVNGAIGAGDCLDWRCGGINLYEYAVPSLCPQSRVPPDALTVIAHSHGLQVALFAAASGLKIGHLVSVCSPIRQDLAKTTRLARPNIARWVHIHSDDSDQWQVLGEFGDGSIGITREAPLADENYFVPGVGHTGMLEQANFSHWIDHPQWLK